MWHLGCWLRLRLRPWWIVRDGLIGEEQEDDEEVRIWVEEEERNSPINSAKSNTSDPERGALKLIETQHGCKVAGMSLISTCVTNLIHHGPFGRRRFLPLLSPHHASCPSLANCRSFTSVVHMLEHARRSP